MREIDPQKTNRAMAFDLWMNAPIPMVTIFKTLNITHLIHTANKNRFKFNMLMCWCIAKTASLTEEFYILPIKDQLVQYDKLAINVIVKTIDGSINTCDIPFSNDIVLFNNDYIRLTKIVYNDCKDYNIGEDYAIIGTSALVKYDIDGIVNLYSGIFNNPFMIWAKYKRRLTKITLAVSFQFHHTQMDGEQACLFLDKLQKIINDI